ncbi:MAG: hypothetical protein M3Y71_13440 [Actinomycetota bacterium]|nr:hypothetical protein [Actinomycetota bacterium]
MRVGAVSADPRRRGPRDVWVRALLGAAFLGVVLGASNSLSNVFGSAYSPHSLSSDGIRSLEVLGALLGTRWAWPVAAFGIGWWTRRPLLGSLAGVVGLLAADVTYYWSDAVSGFSGGLDVFSMCLYAALAVPAGLVMGLLGALARQQHGWSLVPGLMAPAFVIWFGTPTGPLVVLPWPERITWALVVALTVLLLGRWLRLPWARRSTQSR